MSALSVLATMLLLVVAFLLTLPFWAELYTLGRALSRQSTQTKRSASTRLLFLVPAHDEELMVEACVRSLLEVRQADRDRRIIVVADNCTDSTAQLARASGVECWERHAPTEGGKPRALAWAIARLDLTGWDAVVIIDADTTVDPAFTEALGPEMPLRDRAVQTYFGTLNEADNWLTRLAGLLARCRYDITYPLKRRAGLNCPLTGNGMVIGTNLLADGGWRHFSITENWEMYADFTARGVAIGYAPGALIYSHEVESLGQGGIQRRRWMAGRLHVLRAYAAALLTSRRIGFAQKLDALVELGALSPVLHLFVAACIGALGLWTGGVIGVAVAGLTAASLLPLVIVTTVALVRHPDPGPTLRALLMVPFYAVWRVLVAIRTLLTLRDRTWRKTLRPGRG